MKTSWTKGLDSQQQEDVKSSFKAGIRLRQRLSEMCESKSSTSLTTNKEQYESPNWCYQQADNVGYRRALKEIVSLLES